MGDTVSEKLRKLEEIYHRFDRMARPFVRDAVCGPGCADCCTNVGEIAVTTLEGIRIRNFLQELSVFQQSAFREKLRRNREEKRHALLLPCPFLNDLKRCSIYPVRPFSCRRLYSVEPCAAKGPVVHKELWRLAEETTRAIRSLDGHGCSGHVSAVLTLLDDDAFRRAYLKGKIPLDRMRSWIQEDHIEMNKEYRGRL